jgi:hypothetical protein
MLDKMVKTLLAQQNVDALNDNPLVKASREKWGPQLEGQPFLECQVVLKGGHQMAGVLTALVNGSMMMVSIGQLPDKRVMLVETFFGDNELQCVSIGRPMDVPKVQPVNGGRSIIMPQ